MAENLWHQRGLYLYTEQFFLHDINANPANTRGEPQNPISDSSRGVSIRAPIVYAEYMPIQVPSQHHSAYGRTTAEVRISSMNYSQNFVSLLYYALQL